VTRPEAEASRPSRPGTGIGRAAALIAVLTVVARLLGLGRQVVFAHTVRAGCLGTAYATANQIPNYIYDIVLGGALTSIMVPVLARAAQRSAGDPEAAQTSSALLTWTVAILVPVSAALALAARPIAVALNPVNPHLACPHADMVAVTTRMLTVFAPQVLCYGLAVVLYGILQAHQRFTGPALAPVLSSLVVIGTYLLFVPFGHGHAILLRGLSPGAELILAVGTTLGVVALVVTALVPAVRLRLRLRPTFRFPLGVGRQARGLAAYGIAALIAQDASGLVVIVLANSIGPRGGIVLYGYSWQAFESLYAVLAIPIAVSAFPVLSAREGQEFDDTAASSARAVLLMSCLGAALLVAIAGPAARILATGPRQVPELAIGLAVFAPGLIGFGLMACLSRVLLALHRTAVAAAAMSGGWLAVIVADLLLVHAIKARYVVVALGLGNTIGLTLAAVALVIAVRRARGAAALLATARAAAAGLAAAVAAGAAGTGAALLIQAHRLGAARLPVDFAAAGVAAICAAAVFGLIAYLLDGGELRAAVARVRRTAAR
jgi:putative peptidoglycan lipid II flippase